jgi:hypothetical protein
VFSAPMILGVAVNVPIQKTNNHMMFLTKLKEVSSQLV